MSHYLRRLCIVLAWTSGCSPAQPLVDSKTNWFSECRENADCEEAGLSCLCGVCSATCSGEVPCPLGSACVTSDDAAASVQCGGASEPYCAPECDAASCAEGEECVLGACARSESPTAEACLDLGAWSDSDAQFEFELLETINRARTSGTLPCASGALPPLTFDVRLRCASRIHVRDMLDLGYLDVASPAGMTVADRVALAGYPARTWGGSISQETSQTPDDFVSFVSDQFATGTANQRLNCLNIADPDFSDVGMAYSEGIFSITYGYPE